MYEDEVPVLLRCVVAGVVKLIVRYTPKVLEDMEAKFERQRHRSTQQTLQYQQQQRTLDRNSMPRNKGH